MKWLSVTLVALLAMFVLQPVAWAQTPAPAAEAKPPANDAAKSGDAAIAKAWAELHAAEKEHPGNSAEVCQAMEDLIGLMLDAHAVDEGTLTMVNQEVAMALAGPGPRTSAYIGALGELAEVLVALDRPAEARPIIEKAFDIALEAIPNEPDFEDVSITLGYVCSELGDYPCALKGQRQALALARKLQGKDAFDIVGPLSNMANTLSLMGDHAGAIAALEEGLALAYAKDPDNPHLLAIENNIGAEYSKSGAFDKAVPHLNKAIALAKSMYGPDSPLLGEMDTNLAALYGHAGQFDLSYQYWQEGIHALRPAGLDASHAHSNYGRSLAAGGRATQAIAEGLTGARMGRENFVLTLRTLPERQALAFDRRRAHGLDLAISVVARHPDLMSNEVFQEVVRSRAMVADEMARRQQNLNRANDPEIAQLLKQLDGARSTLLALEQAKNASTDAVAQATDKMERAERAVAERSASFRNDERLSLVTLEDVRRNLPKGSLLISYVRYGQSVVDHVDAKGDKVSAYAAFVFHPDGGKIRVFDLGLSAGIDGLVKSARKTVDTEIHSGGLAGKRNERAYRDAAGALSAKVWEPLKAEFAGATLLLVVPDGELNMIPFAALPDGDGYWLDHGPVIHTLSSERDLVPQENTTRKAGLVAIGNPTFGLSGRELATAAPVALPAQQMRGAGTRDMLSCEEFSKVQFHPLPQSEAEIADIASQWKQANGDSAAEFLGADATRDRFLQQAVKGRVLHVATHAFLLSQSCGDGNPLLHSGLVFAGANSSRETSLLTAQQIASLDLGGLDWAVLSACNTGGGELRDGEGVLGLQRAFRVAGAHSVILTLWPVDDETSRRYMHELYAQRFGNHASTADAVWNASRKLLADQRAAGKSTHPWYWAGFVGSGAWQ